jgi:hypothetical protein
MALGWSKSFSSKVKSKTGYSSSKSTSSGSNTTRSSISSSSKSSSSSTPKISQSSNFIATTTPTKTSSIQTTQESNSEKYARLQAEAKEREDNIKKQKEIQQGKHIVEQYDIHAKKIAGVKEHGGNTDNYFVNTKTGQFSQKASDVSNVNLTPYLKETYGLNVDKNFTFGSVDILKRILSPVKLDKERQASKTRTTLLRHDKEIKSMGGKIPDLDLRSKAQVKKYTEISNIITSKDKIQTEQPLGNFEDTSDNFISSSTVTPVSQIAKTSGESQIQESNSKDTQVLSLGFSPDGNETSSPEWVYPNQKENISETSQEDKSFIEKSGGMIAILGAGLVGLLLLSRRK